MEIHAPKLPPMRGYIEVEVGGKREYRGPVKASAAGPGPDAEAIITDCDLPELAPVEYGGTAEYGGTGE